MKTRIAVFVLVCLLGLKEEVPAQRICTSSRASLMKPLIIVDSMEVSNSSVKYIDVNSIKEFSVLREDTALAIYGSRAAAEVIVIHTKYLSERKWLGISEILKSAGADSAIGKYSLLTINGQEVDDTTNLRIDASVIESVKLIPATGDVKSAPYFLQIGVKSNQPVSDSTAGKPKIMIRGDETGSPKMNLKTGLSWYQARW